MSNMNQELPVLVKVTKNTIKFRHVDEHNLGYMHNTHDRQDTNRSHCYELGIEGRKQKCRT